MSKLGKIRELVAKRFQIRKQLKWLLIHSKPYAGRLTFMITIDTLLTFVSMGCTLLNKRVIDNATTSGFDLTGLLILVGCTLVSILFGAFSDIMSMMIREKYSTGIRADMFHRTLKSRWQQLTALHTGDTVSRITADVDSAAGGIASLLPGVFYLMIRFLLAFIVLFRFDRILAFTALLLGPLCVAAGWLFSGRLKDFDVRLKTNDASYRAFMQETVAGVTVIKSFGRESTMESRLEEIRNERLSLVKKKSIFNTIVSVSVGILFRAGYLIAFGWGIWQISRGNITYGTMSVFLSLVSQIQSPVMSVYSLLGQLIGVLASVERVMEIEEMPAEDDTAPITVRTERIGLEWKDVIFSYDRDRVLNGGRMRIEPGECVGLVGPSGIGKTSVARVLLALVYPDAGEVRFFDDDGNTADVSVSTRKLISYVPQGNTLFSGTIRENLQTGSENATDDEMWQALAAADAGSFVHGLAEGLDGRIGEQGIGLSEGQAQRIAIARALLRKAPFLILDEATASLDVDTERRIMENLRKAKENMTCLIITHRPSLLELCDECFAIENGILGRMKISADNGKE